MRFCVVGQVIVGYMPVILSGSRDCILGKIWRLSFFVLFLSSLTVSFLSAEESDINQDVSFVGESGEMIELSKNLMFRSDYMSVDVASGNISAKGNVEIEGRGLKLRSQYLDYDNEAQKLRAYGHVFISLGVYGDFIADDISFDIEDNRIMTGLIQGLLGDNHKFSASSSQFLTDGREIDVLRVTYTVCPVCTEEERESGESGILPKPIWQLRVGQVIENDDETLLLKNISLELFGLSVPFLFFPEFAVLNPNVRRKDGVLFFRGGAGRTGLFVGLPYFMSRGSDTNLFLTLYLGTNYSMLGGKLENITEKSNLDTEILYRPKLGESRFISDDKIERYGVKADYEYRFDENWRYQVKVDTVSDPHFRRDYLYLYNRLVSPQAQQEYTSQIEFFDENKYGLFRAGNVTNLYGTVPLSNNFIESRWRQEIQSEGGVSWTLKADHLDFQEIYTPSFQEATYDTKYGEIDNLRKTSGFAANHVGVERRRVVTFDNGVRLSSSFSLEGFSRQREGDVYTGILKLWEGRYEEGRFEEAKNDSRLWGEARQEAILSWPLLGSVFGKRVTVDPFIGITNTGIFGSDSKGFCGHQISPLCESGGIGDEEIRFIRSEATSFTRRVFSEASRTPTIDGMDDGARVILGGEASYIELGYGDIRLYGGTSFQISDKTDISKSPYHAFDGDLFYSGAQLLWGEDKFIIYDFVYDMSRGEEVSSSLGLRMNFQDRVYFESNYIKLRADQKYYDKSIELSEVGVRSRISDQFSLFASLTRDLNKDYLRFSTEVIYEIPCFNLRFGFYGETNRDRYETSTEDDSGILFSLDLVSIDRESNSNLIFDR